MDFTIPVLGLMVILCAWVLQLIHAFRGRKEMDKNFIMLYVVGCIALSFDAYGAGQMKIAVLNLGCVVFSTALLVKLSGK